MSDGRQIRVVGIVGSLRKEGYTRRAVDLALEGARQLGAEVERIDLHELDLPFVESGREEGHPGVQRLEEALTRAHGIILGTPEYHGGYSGVLKNALDLMGFEQFEGKMMGLVSVAGGALGGSNALNDLRNVGRALHTWVVPEQASIPRAGRAFEGDTLTDERLAERVREVGRQVARFAYLHSSDQWREFLREWEAAPSNPGGARRASGPLP